MTAQAPATWEHRTALAEDNGAWAQSLRLGFRFIGIVLCVLAIGWAVSNLRQVPPDSRAVVLRLGRVVHVQGAGLLLAWPPPIERVLILPAADRQLAYRIGRFEPDADAAAGEPASVPVDPDPRRNTGFVMTGDGGVVHLAATVLYQITDPAAYVVARAHVAAALDRMFVAAAVEICAARDIDAILVARPERSASGRDDGGNAREQLRADLVRAVNGRLDRLAAQGAGLGITVSRVDLAATLPGNAKSAFDQVLTVTQAAEEMTARARTYAETKSQEAAQERDRILADARAAAAEQLSRAQARTAAITALTQFGTSAEDGALLDRIYFERIGPMLKRAKQVDTVDARGGVRLLLPGAGK